ncbi:MAG: fibronectin type III domain-containing protein [Bryobacteraceae bacterium]
MIKSKPCVFYILAALFWFALPPCRADVSAPPTPPPPPAGYCSTILDELNGDLQAFNILLTIPPVWNPITGNGPTIFAGNLQQADANTGPGISGSNYLPAVLTQMQELHALGVKAVMVQVGFPALYEPFFGSQAALQPYLNFYSQLAIAAKAAGLQLIVENDELLSNDIEAGWPGLSAFYATLDWNQYMAARASMAATVAETMQPDFLVLSEEPDAEAAQTGQSNMNNPADAAQMISGMIAAVRPLNLPIKLGAGFGTWLNAKGSSSLLDYLTAYVALPLDYIDFHLYPINSEPEGSFIDNTLIVASTAALAGKPVAMSEGWVWKMENSEWNVLNGQDYRARDPFSFWGPLDSYYLQTVEALAKYTNMLYAAPEGPDYFITYQTYGGTASNGGAANCTCTTESCSDYNIVHEETTLASSAMQVAQFSSTGFSYSKQLVSPPDKTPPSTPTNLTGRSAYNQVTLTWDGSTDNVGVAGYNVYRCTPSESGGSCTGVWVTNATQVPYVDQGLAEDTLYNYQVQAFDLANNNSPMSEVLGVQTAKSQSNAPTNLVVTAVSATEIDLAWAPPQDSSGLSQYLIYAGPSTSSLQQIGTKPAGVTTYDAKSLSPGTLNFFAVAAVESGVTSHMSPAAWTSTYPLPAAPTGVTAAASGDTAIVLTWQENIVHGGLPVTSYQVLRGANSGDLAKIATVAALTYTNASLKPDTTYYYEVVAVDSGKDDSAASSEVSATTP